MPVAAKAVNFAPSPHKGQGDRSHRPSFNRNFNTPAQSSAADAPVRVGIVAAAPPLNSEAEAPPPKDVPQGTDPMVIDDGSSSPSPRRSQAHGPITDAPHRSLSRTANPPYSEPVSYYGRVDPYFGPSYDDNMGYYRNDYSPPSRARNYSPPSRARG